MYRGFESVGGELFECDLAEVFGAVEVGVGNTDWIPRQEVGSGEFVAALVEIAARIYAGE